SPLLKRQQTTPTIQSSRFPRRRTRPVNAKAPEKSTKQARLAGAEIEAAKKATRVEDLRANHQTGGKGRGLRRKVSSGGKHMLLSMRNRHRWECEEGVLRCLREKLEARSHPLAGSLLRARNCLTMVLELRITRLQ